jgi:hypothetical protein
MADILQLADYKLSGPAAVRALMACELAPGITVHAAAWTFAMPDAEYEKSDVDADAMAALLEDAGLAWFPGNLDQSAVLVLKSEALFRRKFRALACREGAMDALGSGIRVRRDPALCV